MVLTLEDQGDGWIPELSGQALRARVIGEHAVPGEEPYIRTEFSAPIQLQEAGGSTFSGLTVNTYAGAWVRSRWRNHPVNTADAVSVFFWLIRSDDDSAAPPVDSAPRLWAMCRASLQADEGCTR